MYLLCIRYIQTNIHYNITDSITFIWFIEEQSSSLYALFHSHYNTVYDACQHKQLYIIIAYYLCMDVGSQIITLICCMT
jgi:hypothetical protein